MTAPLILDASVLIAVMQPADAHHVTARRILRTASRTTRLQAHALTLAEASAGAARHGHLSRVRAAFARLGITATPQSPDHPWRLADLRATTGLSLLDCCVLDAAEQAGGVLATFDARLARAAALRGVPTAATGSPADPCAYD